MRKLTKCLITLVFITSLTMPALSTAADVPQTLNYQGNLTDSTGQPVTGSHSIVFNLYNALSGGTSFWTETQTVQVTAGRFSVVLGKKTPLDTTQFTGDTYIGIKVDSNAEMVPRQQFTSVAYALKAGSLINPITTTTSIMPDPIPKGLIAMWSGSKDQIPSGWALCDGTNNTPNLTDKFIVGVASNYNIGATGGNSTINLQHSHTVNDHTHTYSGTTDQAESQTSITHGSNQASYKDHTHTYSGTTSGASDKGTDLQLSTSQSILPPYFTLAYIIKL